MKTALRRALLLVLLGSLAACAPAARRAAPLKAFFFSSAACFFFPDGGLMVVDIGSGITPGLIAGLRSEIVGPEIVYRALAAVGWRPRIDWLIVAPLAGQWDYRFVDALKSFDIRSLYFPFDVARNKAALGPGSVRLLLQLSMSGYQALDLSRERIDIAQSASGVRYIQLLPQGAAGEDDPAALTALCAVIEYNKVRILIVGGLSVRQQEQLLADPARLKADVFFHDPALLPAFAAAVGASRDIPFGAAPRAFVIDGTGIIAREE